MLIKPTIGRVVWYHSSYPHEQPLAALIAFVYSDAEVNLAAFTLRGNNFPAHNVVLWDGEGERPTGEYAEWMPYQQGQAKKNAEEKA